MTAEGKTTTARIRLGDVVLATPPGNGVGGHAAKRKSDGVACIVLGWQPAAVPVSGGSRTRMGLSFILRPVDGGDNFEAAEIGRTTWWLASASAHGRKAMQQAGVTPPR